MLSERFVVPQEEVDDRRLADVFDQIAAALSPSQYAIVPSTNGRQLQADASAVPRQTSLLDHERPVRNIVASEVAGAGAIDSGTDVVSHHAAAIASGGSDGMLLSSPVASADRSHRPAAAPQAHRAAMRFATLESELMERGAEWWPLEQQRAGALAAASAFDGRHSGYKHGTSRAIKETASRPYDLLASKTFSNRCGDLFRNRFVLPAETKPARPPVPVPTPHDKRGREKAAAAAAATPKRKSGHWRLEASIWNGRQFRGGEVYARLMSSRRRILPAHHSSPLL